MKKSKYTFLFDIDRKEFYAYNTLINALVEIDNETYSRLLSCEEEAELSESSFDQDLLKALIDQNVLTENDDDDYLKYKYYYNGLSY